MRHARKATAASLKSREVMAFEWSRPGRMVTRASGAQSRRSVQQDVVERFAAGLGSLDVDAQVVEHLLLSGEVVEGLGAQGAFDLAFAGTLAFPCWV